MSLAKRLTLTALLFGLQSLYIPLNRFLRGGMEFKTPLDDFIPVWPIWVVPYLLVWFWWAGGYVWAALHMDDPTYRAFFMSSAFVAIAGLTIFSLAPTYVVRPTALEHNEWNWLLRWLYAHDQMYNAFPSGHVYISTLIALYWTRLFPRWKWLWWGSVVVVTLSTLFTHQHYLPDPLGGLLLAVLGYRVGLWLAHDAVPAPHDAAPRPADQLWKRAA